MCIQRSVLVGPVLAFVWREKHTIYEKPTFAMTTLDTLKDAAATGGKIALDVGAHALPIVEEVLVVAERIPLVGAGATLVKDFITACKQRSLNKIYFAKIEKLIEIAWMWIAELDRDSIPDLVRVHLEHVEDGIIKVIRLATKLQHLDTETFSIFSTIKGLVLSERDERNIDLALDELDQPVNRLIGALSVTGYLTTDIMEKIHSELKEPFVSGAEWDHLFKQFHPGTRKAVHETIDMWREDNRTKRLLWVLGAVGVGKTTFCSSLVKKLRDSKALVGAVLFKYNDANRTPMAALVSVVFQLAQQQPLLRRIILHGLKLLRIKYDGFSDFTRVFHLLVVAPLQQLPMLLCNSCGDGAVPSPVTQFIVFDGLDEVPVSQRSAFLDFLSSQHLAELLQLAHVRMIVFSRPKDDFSDINQCVSKAQSDVLTMDNGVDNEEDLKGYCRWRLEELHFPDNIINDAVDIIVKNSEMKFVYLKMVDRVLSSVAKRIQSLPATDVESVWKFVVAEFTDLPVSVNDCYQKYIEQLEADLPTGVGMRNLRLMVWKTLSVLLAAYEPLTVKQIGALLNDDGPCVEHYAKFIDVVFPMDCTDSTFRPYHKSFVDWLGKSMFSSLIHDGHKCIVGAMTQFLSQPVVDCTVHQYASKYFIDHLVHLDRLQQAYEIITDLRWILRKIDDFGLDSAIIDIRNVATYSRSRSQAMNVGSCQLLQCMMPFANKRHEALDLKRKLCSHITGRLVPITASDSMDGLKRDAAAWLSAHGGAVVIGPSLNQVFHPLLRTIASATDEFSKIEVVCATKLDFIITMDSSFCCCKWSLCTGEMEVWSDVSDSYYAGSETLYCTGEMSQSKRTSKIPDIEMCVVENADRLLWRTELSISMLCFSDGSDRTITTFHVGDIHFLHYLCHNLIVFRSDDNLELCVFDFHTGEYRHRISHDNSHNCEFGAQRQTIFCWSRKLNAENKSVVTVWDVASFVKPAASHICNTLIHDKLVKHVVGTFDQGVVVDVQGMKIHDWSLCGGRYLGGEGSSGFPPKVVRRLFAFQHYSGFAFCDMQDIAYVVSKSYLRLSDIYVVSSPHHVQPLPSSSFVQLSDMRVKCLFDISAEAVVTLGFDGNLHIWNIASCKSVLLGGGIANIRVENHFIFAFADGGEVMVMDTSIINMFPVISNENNAVSPSHKTMIKQLVQLSVDLVVSMDSTERVLLIWNIGSGLCVKTLFVDKPCVEMHASQLGATENWLVVRTESSMYLWRNITEHAHTLEGKYTKMTTVISHAARNYSPAGHLCWFLTSNFVGVLVSNDLRIYKSHDVIDADRPPLDVSTKVACWHKQIVSVGDSWFAAHEVGMTNLKRPHRIVKKVVHWHLTETRLVVLFSDNRILLWNVVNWNRCLQWKLLSTTFNSAIIALRIDLQDDNMVIAMYTDWIVLWDTCKELSRQIFTFAQFFHLEKHCFGIEFPVNWSDNPCFHFPSHGASSSPRTIKVRDPVTGALRCVVARDSGIHVVEHFPEPYSDLRPVESPFDIEEVLCPKEMILLDPVVPELVAAVMESPSSPSPLEESQPPVPDEPVSDEPATSEPAAAEDELAERGSEEVADNEQDCKPPHKLSRLIENKFLSIALLASITISVFISRTIGHILLCLAVFAFVFKVVPL